MMAVTHTWWVVAPDYPNGITKSVFTSVILRRAGSRRYYFLFNIYLQQYRAVVVFSSTYKSRMRMDTPCSQVNV